MLKIQYNSYLQVYPLLDWTNIIIPQHFNYNTKHDYFMTITFLQAFRLSF